MLAGRRLSQVPGGIMPTTGKKQTGCACGVENSSTAASTERRCRVVRGKAIAVDLVQVPSIVGCIFMVLSVSKGGPAPRPQSPRWCRDALWAHTPAVFQRMLLSQSATSA